jgi:hypothetical protein
MEHEVHCSFATTLWSPQCWHARECHSTTRFDEPPTIRLALDLRLCSEENVLPFLIILYTHLALYPPYSHTKRDREKERERELARKKK